MADQGVRVSDVLQDGCVLGIDPGVNLGLVVVRRRQPHEAGKFGYVVVHHSTITSDSTESVTDRLDTYRPALTAVVAMFQPSKAIVETPWRKAKDRNALSIYTRSNMNVGSIGLLCAITGCVLTALRYCGVEVTEVPAPTGKSSKNWEAQKEREALGIFGLKLKKHEAVAAMLALRGL